MRKWGIIISAFYALILLGLIVPLAVFLYGDKNADWDKFLQGIAETYSHSMNLILVGAVLVSQMLLLFLSVDSSQKLLKPRAHVLVSCAVTAILTSLLMGAAIVSVGVAARGDKFGEDSIFKNGFAPFISWALLWLIWGIVFYLYFRNSFDLVTRLMSWLLKGSILELLIVVPCHVIVRRRHDCSAPAVTSFGIATGVAIMLLSFGPSVLFLYKKRLDAYAHRSSG